MRRLQALLWAALLLGTGCAVPLEVRVKGESAIVDVQSLGEYPSDVGSVALVDLRSGHLIWHLVPDRADRFQMHTFELHAGKNETQRTVSWGVARTQVPANLKEFRLETGVPYRVQVCAPGWLGRCRSAEFMFQSSRVPT